MHPVLAEVIGEGGIAVHYDALPEALKQVYSPAEHAWLSDHEKATLVQRETEPDVD